MIKLFLYASIYIVMIVSTKMKRSIYMLFTLFTICVFCFAGINVKRRECNVQEPPRIQEGIELEQAS